MSSTLPFHDNWDQYQKICGLIAYLSALLHPKDPQRYDELSETDQASMKDQINRFFKQLVETRYAQLSVDPWVEGLTEVLEREEEELHSLMESVGLLQRGQKAIALPLGLLALEDVISHANRLRTTLGQWLNTPQGEIELANYMEVHTLKCAQIILFLLLHLPTRSLSSCF